MIRTVRKTLPKQIAEMLEEQIRNGEYQIGDKLPPEPVLVEALGVSRNTLREAIQSLTHSGLLETRQGDGTYVIASERLQVDFFHIMNSTTHQNVLEVRNMLEKQVVISAARSRDDRDIQKIEQCLHLRNQGTASIREASQADLDFHLAIAEATHNDIILNIYRYVSQYFNEFIFEKLNNHTKDQQCIDEIHEMLFQAIRDKNVDLALNCVNRIIEL